MRFASIVFVCLFIAGCSSDEPKGDTTPKVNACVAAGGKCLDQPFGLCPPGDEKATDPSRASACGKSVSDDKTDVPCCLPGLTPQDAGVSDTGRADADSDADAASDATTDASDDASSETSTDAADAG